MQSRRLVAHAPYRMNYFETVGREIEASLASAGEAARFADIATQVLRDVQPPQNLDYAMVLDWISRQSVLPFQCNNGDFGQPTVVVYHHENFYVELIVWFPSSTPIHGHGFEGAFRVLRGASLQAEYAYESHSKPCEGIELGELKLRTLEMIGPGEVSTISLGETFVHQVAHLGNPSLTLVARTHAVQTDREQQLSYFQSGLAYAPHLGEESINRQIKALMAMRRAQPQQFPHYLRKFLSDGDAHRRFACLHTLAARVVDEAWAKLINDDQILGSELLDVKIAQTMSETRRILKLHKALVKFPDSTKQLLFLLEILLGPKEQRDEILDRLFPGEAIFEQWQQVVAAEY